MTTTKKLQHKLFITALIITITSSHQLHGMEKVKTNDEITMDKDFQAYKFLSSLNNDHQCYLLPELVKTIVTKVSQLIDKDCYAEYEAYLNERAFIYINDPLDGPKPLLDFIKLKLDNKINHISIVNMVKRYLRHSGKSLDTLKDNREETIFHCLRALYTEPYVLVELTKILNLIAGNEAWNIICMKDVYNQTILHHCIEHLVIKELLSVAPNSQAAWDLIVTPGTDGETSLSWAKQHNLKYLIELFESYRPKEEYPKTDK